MSQADAKKLKESLGISAEYNMGSSRVEVNSQFQQKYGWMPNLWFGEMYRHIIFGKIPGEETEQMILLTAHYDSYFDGFQDDNAAVAMIIGMAKGNVEGGYRPAHTTFARWLQKSGVYQILNLTGQPGIQSGLSSASEWRGHIIADLNFGIAGTCTSQSRCNPGNI